MNLYFDFSIFSGEYLSLAVVFYSLIVGLVTCVCSSVLGVNLVLKRYSMIGDGLSHVGFLALAIAALFGITGSGVTLITFPVVIAAAFLLMWLSATGILKGDSATAVVSVGTVAAGYVIFGLADAGAGDICSGLFGSSVLTVGKDDVILCSVIGFAVIVLYILFYKKIFAVTFDEKHALSAGVNTKAVNMLIAALTAVTVVVGMKLIGSMMISAVIVIPAITAMKSCRGFKSTVLMSSFISAACFVAGYLFSVTFVIDLGSGVTVDTVMLPVGATVVCFNIIVLLISSAVRKITHSKRRKKEGFHVSSNINA